MRWRRRCRCSPTPGTCCRLSPTTTTAAPNAFATPARWLSRADGTVIFGRTLLAHLLKAREHPDVGGRRGGCARVRPYRPVQVQPETAAAGRAEYREAARTACRLSCRLFCRRPQAGAAGLSGRGVCDDAVFGRRPSPRPRQSPRHAGRARRRDRQGIRDRVPRSPFTGRSAADRREIRADASERELLTSRF